MKKYPKIIYSKIENAGTENEFLNAQLKYESYAEFGKRVVIGEYKLVREFGLMTQIKESK